MKSKFNELINYNAKDFKNLKQYEDFFLGNAAPVLNPDHKKLSEICYNIYKESKKNSGTPTGAVSINNSKEFEKQKISSFNSNLSKKKAKNNFNKEMFNNGFNKYIEDQLSSFKNYIKEKFLQMPINFFWSSSKFEWCDKTYSGYDFFYKLTNKNTKGTKIASRGTMTVLRAKEILEENYIYKIQFQVGYTYGGDFDIGIGKDRVGESCWLRTKESLCISNTGVIILDLNMDNSLTINDKDIINLEINT